MMKRECLLSKAYTSTPMVFRGVAIAYSPLVNELMRELANVVFSAGRHEDQTEHLALVEAILVMHLLAIDDRKAIAEYLNLSRPERNSRCVEFYLENEEEVEPLKPEILSRLASVIASTVESEGPGKSHPPAPDSSP